MRTLTLEKMVKAIIAAGLPEPVIHPCDNAVSLMTSACAHQTFVPFALSKMKERNFQLRREKMDCEDVAMFVRGYAVELHQADPRDSVLEDPTGINATGIAVGFVFIPGHSVNVIITSDAPDEYTVRFFDFTLGGKEIQLTKEQLDLCKVCII